MPGTPHFPQPSVTFVRFSSLKGGPRKRAACISRPIARSIHAARNRLLSNTHGSVYFPRSLPRDASPVTHPCPSRDEPSVLRREIPHLPIPGRLGHGHSQPGPWPRRPSRRDASRPLFGPQAPARAARPVESTIQGARRSRSSGRPWRGGRIRGLGRGRAR